MKGYLSRGQYCAKKLFNYTRSCKKTSQFSGSTGWHWRFCKRHGIHNLSLQGEKLSADIEASVEFVSFAEFVEQHHFTLNQVFNCDKTGLNFCLLPDKTLASSFERSADGREKVKRELQSMLLQTQQEPSNYLFSSLKS